MKHFYDTHVLPRVIDLVCGLPTFERGRISLLPEASGRVLEIGMGTDIRGADYTKAAVRALRDALWHNSLNVALYGDAGKRWTMTERSRASMQRDASRFAVTSGGVNPTSTIQAVALYIADAMKQEPVLVFENLLRSVGRLMRLLDA